jgi:hypothetical protein
MMHAIVCLFLSGLLLFFPSKLPAEDISYGFDERHVKSQKHENVLQWAKDNLPQKGDFPLFK